MRSRGEKGLMGNLGKKQKKQKHRRGPGILRGGDTGKKTRRDYC